MNQPRLGATLRMAILIAAFSSLVAAPIAHAAVAPPASAPPAALAASCVGDDACDGLTGTVGEGSCLGVDACKFLTGSVGDGSCVGAAACIGLTGTVGDGSCIGNVSCFSLTGAVDDGSCMATTSCGETTGEIGKGSCNAENSCQNRVGNVGEGSCNGDSACRDSAAEVGNNSCNGINACRELATDVGDCELNSIPVAACDAKPDGELRRPGGKLKGRDAYNTDAAGQSVLWPNKKFKVGKVRWVYLFARNAGTTADTLTITATGPEVDGFSVRYFRSSGPEITDQVAGEDGPFTTRLLQPGERYGIRVRIKIMPDSAKGSSVFRLATVSSVSNPDAEDVVAFGLTRRGTFVPPTCVSLC